jgi:hypothetical protein
MIARSMIHHLGRLSAPNGSPVRVTFGRDVDGQWRVRVAIGGVVVADATAESIGTAYTRATCALLSHRRAAA